MLSPQLRKRVFNLWTLFWSSGMTNPLVAIEQITYLLFLKQLETLDHERKAKGMGSIYAARAECHLKHSNVNEENNEPQSGKCYGHEDSRWSHISKNPSHEHISQFVFPWLREIDKILSETGNAQRGFATIGRQMDDAYFQFPREKSVMLKQAVEAIDELFAQASTRSANADLMGDIFEYLLSEIDSSGKNGQFRTPRHIIRFMIELLQIEPGKEIIDPAAGTCGFLINSIQYLRKEKTSPTDLVLEWDGTPHRLWNAPPSREEQEKYFSSRYFTGYDNDRTMVRIGWMNMILHGIENPKIERGDPLGTSFDASESNKYDYVLANPPYTGHVDKADLNKTRFPFDVRKKAEPLTDKSEILFVWLAIDLLKDKGKAAVIVPEGVLFGSTTAHRQIRRKLLFENQLEGVISLPGGVFQPYAGVKTSILVFQKYSGQAVNPEPRTKQVWFYEVEADGYTLDAKREPKPRSNDLWDALEKWRLGRLIDTTDYYQPDYFDVRWRVVDKDCLKIFPELQLFEGKTLGLQERFPELPADPNAATEQVREANRSLILTWFQDHIQAGFDTALAAYQKQKVSSKKEQAGRKVLTDRLRELNSWFATAINGLLERDFEDHARKALSPLLDIARQQANQKIEELLTKIVEIDTNESHTPDADDTQRHLTIITADDVHQVVCEFAKLDGYRVQLRTPNVLVSKILQTKSWSAPVRIYTIVPDWESKGKDGQPLQGSHNEKNEVRPEYLAYLRDDLKIYDEDGTVKAEFLERLDPNCIEVNDLNLSVGRYKPFMIDSEQYAPPAEIIRELQEMEAKIQNSLQELLKLMELA